MKKLCYEEIVCLIHIIIKFQKALVHTMKVKVSFFLLNVYLIDRQIVTFKTNNVIVTLVLKALVTLFQDT